MSESQLPGLNAVPIPSAFPGVSAWITPVTIAPLGISFTVMASMSEPGLRYRASAVLTIGETDIELGGATSADRRFSMTHFWELIDPDRFTDGGAVINLFEVDERSSLDRVPVRSFTLAPLE